MATHCSIPAWKIPWTEEPRGLVHRVANSWRPLSVHMRACAHTHTHTSRKHN